MSKLYDEIFKLKQVERTGWKVKGVDCRKESDAEHTFSMMFLALEIMAKCENNLDQLKVLKMIAYHELGEIDVGDIALVDKAHRGPAKHIAEEKCVKRISTECKMPEILELWQEFENEKTKEAKFVKLMDRYDAICQAQKYDEMCKRDDLFKEFSTNAFEEYKQVLKMIENKKI